MAEQCRTIGDCLRQVGIDVGALERCKTLEDEFKCIKKAYFKKILRSDIWLVCFMPVASLLSDSLGLV